jgi:ATP-binding cassette subfamily B protein
MKNVIKEYWRETKKQKFIFVGLLFLLVVVNAMDVVFPLVYKNIANGFAAEFSAAGADFLMHNLFLLAVAFAVHWFAFRIFEVLIIPMEAGSMRNLEKHCFDVLQNQKFEFFQNNFSGSLIKQTGRFVRSFESVLDWFFFQFFNNVLIIVFSLIVFSLYDITLAFVFFGWVLFFIVWNVLFFMWKNKYEKAVADWDSKTGATYSDAISNISTIKIFANENEEQQTVNTVADTLFQKRKIAWALTFVGFAIQGISMISIEIFLVFLMIQKWKQGNFEVGEFVLFQSVLLYMFHRLWDFGQGLRRFFSALADATDMADLLQKNSQEKNKKDAKALHIEKGKIEFQNVSFSYEDEDHTIFEDFSLTIQPGEKIALVGHSGSGKTTITKLLFRFFSVEKGAIFIDNQNIEDVTYQSLRKNISLVPQQPDLFHRTLLENISLQKNAKKEDIEMAAKKAQCEFIYSLPQQFDTLVGERGVKLSGGERQRVAIARAFLENAPIVILDEATSALDSVTEQKIQTAIFDLIEKKTSIVIAHRLSTILKMDRIVVLEKGRIIEQGTHDELLQKNGKYAEMWNHQSGGFLLDE